MYDMDSITDILPNYKDICFLKSVCIGVLRHMQRYFSYICDGIWIRRRTEEEVEPTVGLPTPLSFGRVL